MLTDHPAFHKRIVLHPGECHVSKEPVVLSTLLGSCVSVCMYDPIAKVMGMNHFLLATRRTITDGPVLYSEAGRYGIHAMELLINGLLRIGANRDRLKAKAFGGGNVLGTCSDNDFGCVSKANVVFVLEFLENDGIPLLAADLGGNFGRQLHFAGDDYSVYVKRIDALRSKSVVAEERHYWRESLDAPKTNRAEWW